MRKDKLIEMLSKIDGNPDIYLWNGFVEDWVDISPELFETTLVRMSLDSVYGACDFEKKKKLNDWGECLSDEEKEDIKKSYAKNHVWEHNLYVTGEDISSGHYKSKRVFFLTAKHKGTSTWDRLGTINY